MTEKQDFETIRDVYKAGAKNAPTDKKRRAYELLWAKLLKDAKTGLGHFWWTRGYMDEYEILCKRNSFSDTEIDEHIKDVWDLKKSLQRIGEL